jgi:hypothetical protein
MCDLQWLCRYGESWGRWRRVRMNWNPKVYGLPTGLFGRGKIAERSRHCNNTCNSQRPTLNSPATWLHSSSMKAF